MANLKKLNSDIRAAKRSKKKTKKKKKVPGLLKEPKPAPEEPKVDFTPLVEALKNLQPPVVNIEQREPVGYKITVDINSRGDMVGAKLLPMK